MLRFVEASVAKWLTPRTPDLEVWGSSLARLVVSLDKELYYTLSLFTQVYKWVAATYCWGEKETRISFGHLSLWPRVLLYLLLCMLTLFCVCQICGHLSMTEW